MAPSTISETPRCVYANFSAMSDTLGFSLNTPPYSLSFAPVLSSMISTRWDMGTMPFCTSCGMPSAEARLASGSASRASTLCPFCAKCSASAADTVDLPTPPFPETAIFIASSFLN